MPEPDEPMTFEEWKQRKDVASSLATLRARTAAPVFRLVTALLALAWGCSQREQMRLDHEAEMERLKR